MLTKQVFNVFHFAGEGLVALIMATLDVYSGEFFGDRSSFLGRDLVVITSKVLQHLPANRSYKLTANIGAPKTARLVFHQFVQICGKWTERFHVAFGTYVLRHRGMLVFEVFCVLASIIEWRY